MTSNFSYDLRILMCQQCGAPFDVDPGGGSVKCEYCGTINQIVPRQTAAQLERKEISEADRMAKLWAQNGKPIPPPDSIRGLLSNGELPANKVDEAIKAFNSTRQEVATSSDYAASERLTHLTLFLYNHYIKTDDTKRQRAILESAVEAFKVAHHKQFVLGILCRCAVKDGDLLTAKEWLRPCDPRSDDLRSDTTYRVGQALIDTAEGRFDNVHRLLGESAKDIPIADGYHAIVTVLRANAWEKRGHADTARALIDEFVQGGGAYGLPGLKFAIGIYPHLQLCQTSIAGAKPGKSAPTAPGQPGAKKSGLPVVGIIFLLLGVILVVIGFAIGSSSRSLYSDGIKTEGTVIAVVPRSSKPAGSHNRSVSYYPVVAYVVEGGMQLQHQSDIGSNPPGYQVGEKVEILYERGNPQNASINSFFQLWGATAILGGIGGFFALIGLLMFIAGLAGRKR